MGISQGTLSFALVTMLVFGITAELLGSMAAITGTFLAGLMFSRTPEKRQFEGGLRALAYGLFVPIFFINIGLNVNVRTLDSSIIWMVLVISLLAVVGKIVGSGLGAKMGGFSWLESTQLGIGMVSRGEVGLIVSNTGLMTGLLDNQVFSAIVGTVLITTLITPPLLRFAFSKQKAEKAPKQPVSPSDSTSKEEII
jgi:Kef-type K+ transport system membrane component KefB